MKSNKVRSPGVLVASYNGFNVIEIGKTKLIKQCGEWVKPCK